MQPGGLPYEHMAIRRLLLMDSILNNTSWAFIESLGYQIKDYVIGSTNAMPNDNSYSAISVPAFSKAFIDVVCDIDNYSSWTIRPFMAVSTNTSMTYMYTTWGITNRKTSPPHSYITPTPWITYSRLPCFFIVRNTTTISFHIAATGDVSTNMTFFFFIVE